MTNLIELQGTEKQIAWANTIRKELVDEMRVIVAESAIDKATDETLMNYINRGFKLALKQEQAQFWIDRRGETGKSLLIREIEICKKNDAKKAAQ